MKKALALFSLIILVTSAYPQQSSTSATNVDMSYFVTHTRAELIQKLVDLPLGIQPSDPSDVILQKIETYLVAFIPQPEYTDDEYAKEANIQALKSIKQGGYGIGSVLVDQNGKIIFAAHNSQIQKNRSDLHAEMTLLTKFEQSHKSHKYMNMYVYKPGLTVFSSAEPCPMCFIRISTAGCDTKYCTPGPEDGMVTRISCLPPSWKEMAMKQKVELGDCSPIMQKLSHLLFYSYLLDNRGPKQE
ncbi:MAG: nucleoside deaminase [Bacteroidales bacterium]|jgi:tRNA(Arg) A34 adenosine deaminase TadA|nr:nucleoside deaminase [Bacteroidales bacterium]